jgi:hypothetical protein
MLMGFYAFSSDSSTDGKSKFEDFEQGVSLKRQNLSASD